MLFRLAGVLITTKLLDWAHFCGASDEVLRPDSGYDMEWGLAMVWALREGDLPP